MKKFTTIDKHWLILAHSADLQSMLSKPTGGIIGLENLIQNDGVASQTTP